MVVSIPDGETFLAALRARIPKQAKLAFVSAFTVGLITHMYMLVNKLPNHDDTLGLFSTADSTFLGRWFLSVPERLSSGLSLPWVNGLLTLLYISLAAAMVVEILRIRRPALAILAAAVMVTFPTVGYTFCYMSGADSFFSALLLAVTGVYLTDRYRWGFLPGGLLMGLSLACYQAYIFCAIALFGARGILLISSGDSDDRTVLKTALRYLLALALAGVVYIVGLKICLRLRQVNLTGYMGLNQLSSFALLGVFQNIPVTYRGFFQILRENSDIFSGRYQRYAFLVSVCLCALVPAVRLVIIRKKSPIQWALLAVLILALPLMFFGIRLVSVQSVHTLMLYSLCFAFLLVIALYDQTLRDVLRPQAKARPLLRQGTLLAGYALTLALAVLSLQWGNRMNQTYLTLELKFDNMMSLATRMVDRVEQLPEYVADETPVWITGMLKDGNYGAVKHPLFAKASATDATGQAYNYTFFFHNMYFRVFVNHYIGVSFVEPEQYEVDRVLASAEYAEMPYFPYAGSVKYIDGIIIINAGPNPQELQ